MMRRRSVTVMMMRRRVYVTVPVAYRVMVRARGTVHVIQEVVVGRQGVVLEIQDVRQEGFAAPLMKLQVAVCLAGAWYN